MVKIKLTSWGRLHIPKYKVFLYFNKVEGDQVGPAGVFAGCGEGHTAGRKLRGWRHGPEGPRGRQGVRGGAITHKRRQMMSDQLCAQISPCTQPESQRMWRKKFQEPLKVKGWGWGSNTSSAYYQLWDTENFPYLFHASVSSPENGASLRVVWELSLKSTKLSNIFNASPFSQCLAHSECSRNVRCFCYLIQLPIENTEDQRGTGTCSNPQAQINGKIWKTHECYCHYDNPFPSTSMLILMRMDLTDGHLLNGLIELQGPFQVYRVHDVKWQCDT